MTRPDWRILYETRDDTIGIVVPIKHVQPELFIERMGPIVGNREWRVIHKDHLPDMFFFKDCTMNPDRDEVTRPLIIDMEKTRARTHVARRACRSMEMRPFDQKIAAQIPGEAGAAETERVKIRKKYADHQVAIDACTTPEQLKAFMLGHYLNFGRPEPKYRRKAG